ncbi:NAD(P)-dependent alcohol dehydrogenase [Polyangium sp. 15x6]|uniref:NAD(P)-dependent alcohol dehydrogenase n=1 Tax=Polyangium sp. 15x6 TaxID=3042687 RepID=UPI00249A1EE2|nr:NAD(P)-dependent alcohol dehydrogenase [Polyangium sp. 15x6]MDI3282562.1 NAD(P)-dependent alcohol dehydrogenase [Polyangium sp. 15x6]
MIVATSRSSREPLRSVELPSRPLRPDELRVRVRAIGVNPVDWKMREGGPLGTAQRIIGPSGPLVVGIDFAGEVVEVGSAVEKPKLGDRVVGGTDFSRNQRGSYADEVIVRADQCAELPVSVSFDDAACLPVAGVTAWRWLEEAGIPSKPGARVLVLGGSGGVGLFALQLARSYGATVAAVCSARNVPLVTRLGATAIDYNAGDPFESAARLGPFDLVLNAMGSAVYPSSACRKLLTATGLLGLVVVRPADYPSLLLSRRTKTLLGKPTRAALEPLVAALAKGEIEAIIEAKFPLAQAEEAHVRSRAGKVVGKLLLVP